MPISAPATPYSQLAQDAQQFMILLGPADGSAPTAANEVDWLVPQRISITAGAARDDVMVFGVDLAKAGKRLMDTTTPNGTKRQVEIRTVNDKGETKIILAWGFLSRNPQQIHAEGETATFEARLSKHHFGKPLTSYPIWSFGGGVPFQVDVNRPLVFNPQIDEIIENNKSDKKDGTNDWAYVIDPESVRTAAARTFQGQTASAWTLPDAVLALCWWLNPDETWIKNPTAQDVQNAFPDRGTMLKNVEIPMNAYLPEALDVLLAPFEFGWYLAHSLGSSGRRTNIRFFARGTGTKKKVFLQRPPEPRDIRKANVAEFDAEYDINALANRIEVYGDFVKTEATFQLQMGWAAVYDDKDLVDELAKDAPFAIDHPSVGRKFVLNEAGDYDAAFRPEFTEPYSLNSLFDDDQTIRRRKFYRCLSQHEDADDRESNGFRVDWYDEDEDGAMDWELSDDPGWKKVKWPYSILEKECGVYFEGPNPPAEIWNLIAEGYPEKVHVRITATVYGDQRVSGIATKRDQSPNGQTVTLALDLHDRFQKSKVDVTSIFSSKPSTARDDTTVIQEYAEKIRNIEDAMKINCSMKLEGVNHPEYQIGDVIDQVEGRNLSLNGYDPSKGADTRNPQIIGFVYHLAGSQNLELLLDTFERERPQVVMDQHQRVLA